MGGLNTLLRLLLRVQEIEAGSAPPIFHVSVILHFNCRRVVTDFNDAAGTE
jgi:hypothetical protein